ncbi:LOW QUALITY PROTEIN: OFCC1 isoform 2, partial [Pongo abelii]
HCQGQEAENMEREKFQQKALKQTKQKKSKSAEFLMVKEDREATEGIGNPAFNMSSPDLSACQTAEKKVIRHDMLDRTLAAHQQKFRLPASAEPKGNEYGRNYFDPLMDEEINPRQCAMEVSREDESGREETLNSEAPGSSRKSHKIHKEASEATTAHLEEFQRSAQKNIILLGSSPLEQDLKFEGEGLNEYIPMSLLKTGKTFEKTPSQPFIADLNICKKDSAAQLGTLTEVTNDSKGAAGPCWKLLRNSRTPPFVENEQSQPPQPLQIQIRCLRVLKDKAPPGSYVLKGPCLVDWEPVSCSGGKRNN